MTLRKRYDRAKRKLLHDPAICQDNRRLFAQFFEYEEYKLRRINGKPSLDDNSFKTLLAYVSRLRVVNQWFANKPWSSLEQTDIRNVYDDLEDGRIRTVRGTPLRDKRTYYKMIIRGKPFALAGKTEMVKQVMQFSRMRTDEQVRFIREMDFRRLVETTSRIEQRAFLWLCWDIGENATALLKLRKRDCVRQVHETSHEVEYLINLRREILKRSRRPRSELTNYPETAASLDLLLKELGDDDLLFDFGEAWGKKLLLRAVQRTAIRCLPGGQRPTLKDLRSSMACDLLSKGWSRDEVNARLGHSPSSREIDRYINYLAIDRVKPKGKWQESQFSALLKALGEMRQQEKLNAHRLQKLKEVSAAQITCLKRLARLNAQIAARTLEFQLGQLTKMQYAGLLKELQQDLVQEQERLDTIDDPLPEFESAG